MVTIINYATLKTPTEIELICDSDVNAGVLTIIDHTGDEYIIKEGRTEGRNISLRTETKINLMRNVWVELDGKRYPLYPSRELLDNYFYSQELLGAQWHKGRAQFRLWSPTAVKVQLILSDLLGNQKHQEQLEQIGNGVWQTVLFLKSGSDYYYHYLVSSFGETKIALDPYAISLEPVKRLGKELPRAALIDSIKIPKPVSKSKIAQTPFIGYELHTRDCSIDPSLNLDESERGTFQGMQRVGIAHLKKLGITHLQLMPVQSICTVDDRDRSFQDETIAADEVNYNWGYDPLNFFALNGHYSANPSEPALRLKEFANFSQELHNQKIGLILDVVYNHIYKPWILENSAPGCYLRRTAEGIVSERTGAGYSLETRCKMVRRLICDSLEWFYTQFGVDGFRFDLMNFIDHETLIEVRKRLGPQAILYGEAWPFTDLNWHEAATKNNLPAHQEIGAFNDQFRDSICAFLNGDLEQHERVHRSLMANLATNEKSYEDFALNSSESLNYLSIHDGHTLWDKINLAVGGNQETRVKIAKLAHSILLSSAGKVVIHAGDELARFKPLTTNSFNPHRAHTSDVSTPEGKFDYFHENSYRAPDTTNMIRWQRALEFSELQEHIHKMVEFRKKLNIFEGLTLSNIRTLERMPSPSVNTKAIKDLSSLEIYFFNGPANESLYLVGDIHAENENPSINPYSIAFDQDGMSLISFTSKQIKQFATGRWGQEGTLSFKLVTQPGSWNQHEDYNSHSHTEIKAEQINSEGELLIDLKTTINDYRALVGIQIDPNLVGQEEYLIAHNCSNIDKAFYPSERLKNFEDLINKRPPQLCAGALIVRAYSSLLYKAIKRNNYR